MRTIGMIFRAGSLHTVLVVFANVKKINTVKVAESPNIAPRHLSKDLSHLHLYAAAGGTLRIIEQVRQGTTSAQLDHLPLLTLP